MPLLDPFGKYVKFSKVSRCVLLFVNGLESYFLFEDSFMICLLENSFFSSIRLNYDVWRLVDLFLYGVASKIISTRNFSTREFDFGSYTLRKKEKHCKKKGKQKRKKISKPWKQHNLNPYSMHLMNGNRIQNLLKQWAKQIENPVS